MEKFLKPVGRSQREIEEMFNVGFDEVADSDVIPLGSATGRGVTYNPSDHDYMAGRRYGERFYDSYVRGVSAGKEEAGFLAKIRRKDFIGYYTAYYEPAQHPVAHVEVVLDLCVLRMRGRASVLRVAHYLYGDKPWSGWRKRIVWAELEYIAPALRKYIQWFKSTFPGVVRVGSDIRGPWEVASAAPRELRVIITADAVQTFPNLIAAILKAHAEVMRRVEPLVTDIYDRLLGVEDAEGGVWDREPTDEQLADAFNEEP